MVYGGSFRWIFQMAAFVILGGVIWLRHRHVVRLRTERYRYQSNSTALASETLRLTLGAYKRFRAEDAAIRDTVVGRDTVSVLRRKV
ncbi:hypothetical protein [uncultured Sanguibacteroides sp.]|uniref:hypothetical protein n=1 Tax=uncultured Sanguibacteroides sp. TaxID=1635151 RepID=UPI0025F55124|nr:hypothetical protein [uncultured Sanguibacteroides sp.]